jgi:hypothetical protein
MALSSNVRVWATAVSTNAHNRRKIIFRYAKELSANFDQTRQPTRINIVWKYQSESGQPVSGDHQRMNQLEDLLESVLKEDGFASLALVSTGEGLREWTYYAKSESEFIAHLNYAVAGLPGLPIEIHVGCDPNWDVYERFRTGVKQS